jgi:hypothetical protein
MSDFGAGSETLTGGCQCGDVRYVVPAHPVALYVCHCTECKKQSSSAFGISYTVPRDALQLTRGDVSWWFRPTDSGHRLDCAFCSRCGSRLWHQSSGSLNTLNIKAGTLDRPVDLSTAVHIWTASKWPGISIPEDAQTFTKGPL